MVGSQLGPTGMTGALGPHLQRRNGIFHFRMRVPKALQLRVGLVEVVRSLKTFTPLEARLLAAQCAMRVTEAFKMIKTTDLSRDEARNMVHAAFAGMVAEVDDGLAFATSRPDLELLEQVHLSDERVVGHSETLAFFL